MPIHFGSGAVNPIPRTRIRFAVARPIDLVPESTSKVVVIAGFRTPNLAFERGLLAIHSLEVYRAFECDAESDACEILLSGPLLKGCSDANLKNTLLHEMIHAFLWIKKRIRDHRYASLLYRTLFMQLIKFLTLISIVYQILLLKQYPLTLIGWMSLMSLFKQVWNPTLTTWVHQILQELHVISLASAAGIDYRHRAAQSTLEKRHDSTDDVHSWANIHLYSGVRKEGKYLGQVSIFRNSENGASQNAGMACPVQKQVLLRSEKNFNGVHKGRKWLVVTALKCPEDEDAIFQEFLGIERKGRKRGMGWATTSGHKPSS